MTHQICKILTLFALSLQLALSIQARLEPALALVEETAQNDDVLYYAPSPYGDDMSPESTYPFDDMASELEGQDQYPPSPSPSPSASAYSPGIEEDYPYSGEYASPAPSPAPYIDVMAPEVDDFYGDDYYSPSEAPSPTDYMEFPSGASMATTPPAEWEYSAEEDAYLSGEEGYGGEKKRGAVGFVIGAVCFVGLGGLVYRMRKTNQKKRKNPVYSELCRTGDV